MRSQDEMSITKRDPTSASQDYISTRRLLNLKNVGIKNKGVVSKSCPMGRLVAVTTVGGIYQVYVSFEVDKTGGTLLRTLSKVAPGVRVTKGLVA